MISHSIRPELPGRREVCRAVWYVGPLPPAVPVQVHGRLRPAGKPEGYTLILVPEKEGTETHATLSTQTWVLNLRCAACPNTLSE